MRREIDMRRERRERGRARERLPETLPCVLSKRSIVCFQNAPVRSKRPCHFTSPCRSIFTLDSMSVAVVVTENDAATGPHVRLLLGGEYFGCAAEQTSLNLPSRCLSPPPLGEEGGSATQRFALCNSEPDFVERAVIVEDCGHRFFDRDG